MSSALIGHWCLCVIHLLVCGALFLWAKRRAEPHPEGRRAIARIDYMTLGLFTYCVLVWLLFSAVYTIPCGGWRVDERAIKKVTALFIVLSVPAWWVLTVSSALIPSVGSVLRNVRFHLATLMGATAIVGLLLGANLERRWEYIFSLPCYCHGWPIPFYFYGGRGLSEVPVGLEIEILLIDLVLWALMLIPPIWLCEWWYRRPTQRPGPAEVPRAN